MKRKPLQSEVRKTRARLAAAQQRGDHRGIVACIAELRSHADRAYDEAKRERFHSRAGDLLRELADKTEGKLWQHKLQS